MTADEVVGGRVQRLVDLDVEVPSDLGLGPPRRVERRAGEAAQQRQLLGAELLDRPALGRAVDAHAGGLGAPGLGAPSHVGQIDERLADEEVVADVGHGPLHARLVGRRGDARRVDDEAPRLGYSKNTSLKRGAVFSASMTIERMLSGITTGNTPPK